MTYTTCNTTIDCVERTFIKVAAAIIEKDEKILIARRQKDDPLKDKWEFPGGKIQEGETPEQCLKREIREELDIEIAVGDLLYSTKYKYRHIAVELFFYRTVYCEGEVKLIEHRDIRWVEKRNLRNYDVPEANVPVLEILERGN
ncbi:MAG: 8-oxo-dGTP diphosphatase MutT [Nitrospiraceae bacterium]|nr:MAG: 8-oxo-dGTP diphosphatase MutT [Nitrospiraceae bacterium]